MSPPLQEAASTADNPGSSDRVGAPEQNESVWDVIAELYPRMQSDPTGQKALRKLQNETGWFEPDARIEMRIKSPSRGDIIILLDKPIAGYVSEIISSTAQMPLPKTRSGRGFNARMKANTPKKNTPEMHVAKQSHHGGHTETDQ